jgi:hypothetical protein
MKSPWVLAAVSVVTVGLVVPLRAQTQPAGSMGTDVYHVRQAGARRAGVMSGSIRRSTAIPSRTASIRSSAGRRGEGRSSAPVSSDRSSDMMAIGMGRGAAGAGECPAFETDLSPGRIPNVLVLIDSVHVRAGGP